MTFTIKSKSSFSDFFDFLKKNGYEPKKVSEVEMVVDVEEDLSSGFESVIAVYISYLLFVKTVKESLDLLPLDKVSKTRFLNDALRYYHSTPYWSDLTLILVSDYLRNSKTFNLDSFSLFNMRGFKAEIQQYVKNILSVEEVDRTKEDESTNGIQEIYAKAREALSVNNVDVSKYEIVHMRGKDDRLLFQTNNGIAVDFEHLTMLLNGLFEIEIHGVTEPWQKDIMLLPSILMILPVKKLIVHRNVNAGLIENIERLRIMLPQDRSIAVEYCNGCDRCDE
ncbi:hypothetical protein ACFVS2_21340 [Brevibacillus sp. NPDC058079]|uniref:hypothetical protein n=1 Tax=Brevibacillus sp. NPDC058079 TaxID=3346330 RepID=UPI0036EAEDC9